MTEVPHANSKFLQQRLPACRPILTPFISVIFYLCVCVVSLGLGLGYYFGNANVWELSIRYDDQCENRNPCVINFEVEEDIENRELFIYYELTRVYQDNFMFTSSKSWAQLEGEYATGKSIKKCVPCREDENGPIAPCGTVPLSLFNDTYSFSSGFPQFTDQGIAIPSVLKIYKQTNEKYESPNAWLRNNPMFPGGQLNERFINWIQTAAFPKFRKLWAKTDGKVSLRKGSYRVTIANNYPVASFKGSKSLIIAETSFSGGHSMFMAWFFIAICVASGLMAVVVFLLHLMNCFPLYRAIAQESNPFIERK
ncbi:hypothetical protein M9Y10_038081 [Tritrichomonas musculus]|uniref:Cell cycle control protein n=1 Tax=Tritrichomonas musculus TaxID=1915356 RepID=A0ABR2KAK6_9EUKA